MYVTIVCLYVSKRNALQAATAFYDRLRDPQKVSNRELQIAAKWF